MTYSVFLEKVIEKASESRPYVFDERKRTVALTFLGLAAGTIGAVIEKLTEIKWYNPFRTIKLVTAIGLAYPLFVLMKEYNMLNREGANFVIALNTIREKYRDRFYRTNDSNIQELIDEASRDLIWSVDVIRG